MEKWQEFDPCITARGWRTQEAMRAYIDDGRSVDEQLTEKEERIVKEGLITSTPALRHLAIIGFDLRPRHWGAPVGEPGENLLTLGCYFYGLPHYVMALSRLVDRLGGRYTLLAKEYCCGVNFNSLPLVRLDKEARDKWLPKAADFMGMNIEEARRLGAKRMYHFCINCVYLSQRFFTDCDVEQRYHLDLIVELMKKAKPKLKLDREVAYFQGCQGRRPVFLGASEWDCDWAGYRKLLGQVEGLVVTDLPRYCCVTDLPRVLEAMEKKQLSTLVTPCNECYGLIDIMRPPEAKFTLRSIPELLLEAFPS